MRGNLLMGHIMEVMREEFTCSAFGTDYSNILLKNVLCAGRKWIEISSTRWHGEIREHYRHELDCDCFEWSEQNVH